MLSEDDIKRIFPTFLKHFYLHRYDYRPGTEKTVLDNVSAEGLIADGWFSFQMPEGQVFTATFEATSASNAGEVKYSLNTVYFLWDCAAFGAVVALAAYALSYVAHFEWLVQLGWVGNLGYILGTAFVGFLAWFFSMRSWRKYRYIYAVEQFKRYYADEQWIALADDVFRSPVDPYLEELRRQCIYSGFGLALVSGDGTVRVLVAPSRLGLYGKDRKIVHWITQREWFKATAHNIQVMQRRVVLPSPLKRTLNKMGRSMRYLVLDPLREGFLRTSGLRQQAEETWKRYMSRQSIQKWIFSLALLFLSPLVYQVLTYREAKVEDVIDLSGGNPEDQYGYLYEGEEYDSRGIPKQYPDHPERQSVPEPTPVSPKPAKQEEIPTINLSGIEDETEPVQQPCYPYRTMRGWIIADNVFVQRALADRRVQVLQKAGISAEVVPEECFQMGQGYIVKIGEVHLRKGAAEREADRLRDAMEAQGVYEGDFRYFNVGQ